MRGFLPLMVVLSGCGVFKSVKDGVDKVKGVTDPMVAQSVILDVEQPQDPNLANLLAAAAFETGTGVNLLVADSVTDPETSPVVGARATLHGSATAQFVDEGGGVYTVTPDEGPQYVVDQFWDIDIDKKGETSTIAVQLPPPAMLDVPPTHPVFADLNLDFSGQGYQSALVVVIDQTGTVTWTNEPQDMAEALDFAGKGDDLELFVVPGNEAFQTESPYAVGVAGLRSNLPEDVENMNTLLSGLQAGRMRWFLTSTIPVP